MKQEKPLGEQETKKSIRYQEIGQNKQAWVISFAASLMGQTKQVLL